MIRGNPYVILNLQRRTRDEGLECLNPGPAIYNLRFHNMVGLLKAAASIEYMKLETGQLATENVLRFYEIYCRAVKGVPKNLSTGSSLLSPSPTPYCQQYLYRHHHPFFFVELKLNAIITNLWLRT
ncbi:hypothetical protein SLE2022_190930 [Rubroshorea leprosula]